MQWNVLGGLGDKANNSSAQARAIARIINYNQPDILLFNEVASQNVLSNTAALIDFVTNNCPYLGTQTGVTFYVAVSTQTDNFNRNAAISRYPIIAPGTYNDGLRGLHSFGVQLAGSNTLQIFHTHLKCCADDCTRKQTEAQFGADTMSAWALTNAGPYLYAGDLNEDEDASPPVCTLSATYHPITTIREDGGVVEFKPTTLSGEYRTWSTTALSIRFDYILSATNRLTAVGGHVFRTQDWAAYGLYTNVPGNLINDTSTASDHHCVFADYFFPTTAPSLVVTPATNFLSSGNQGGPFTPASTIYNIANTNGASVAWTVSKTAAWLTLSATNGTLAGGANTNITATINPAANSLTPATYLDTITFRDVAASVNINRQATLTVVGPPTLTVSPATGFSTGGVPGGPFNPSSQNFVLNNTGNDSLTWTASNTGVWMSLAPVAGTLASGASTTVVATINANANSLGEGVYADTIGFTNLTNSAGNTTRAVTLAVSSNTFGFVDIYATFAPGNLVGQQNWTQIGGSSTSPFQITNGWLTMRALPTNSGDDQDTVKSFGGEISAPVSGTNRFYYAASITVTSSPTNPSYIFATTNLLNAGNFPNHRLVASNRVNGTSFAFGGRVNGQTGYPFSFGGNLNYNTEYALIVEVNMVAGNANDTMRLFINPTSGNLTAQTAYATANYSSGTVSDPPSEGALIISQFTNGSLAQNGIRLSRLAVASTFAGAYNALFPPANFTVTPATNYVAVGTEGGPFSPASQAYIISNTTAAALNWTAGNDAPWLTLDITAGTLPGNTTTSVLASLNSSANFLSPGTATGIVTFTDSGAGGVATRAALLTVLAPANLVVTPAGAFNASGVTGGPFNPASQMYTLQNSGSLSMTWSAMQTVAWLNLAPVTGILDPGASTNVVATINTVANGFSPGSYNGSVEFTNVTNNAGTTARPVFLNVIDPAAGGFFDNMENGTNGWTVTGLWHLISAGTPACATAQSPTHAWWYGIDATCWYRTCGGCTNFGNAISPPFVVPASATLTFWSWEDVEGPGTVNDQRIVYLSTNAGVSWVQLFQSSTDNATWYGVTNSLAAFAGKTAQLRFYFNANANNNRFGGWFIDDVRVSGPGTLSVTPATVWSAAGEQGGPFTPASQQYTLSNPGGTAIGWSAGASNHWLTVAPTNGTLVAGGSTNVAVSVNTNANGLVGGWYSNVVTFANTTSGAGTTNRTAALLVRDGIADAWRQQYFGHVDPKATDLSRAVDDADGDGGDNLYEFIFGSVPTNAGNLFGLQIQAVAPGTVAVGFASLTGRVYTLEFKPALTNTSWQALPALSNAAGTGAEMSVTNTPAGAMEFYRLRGRLP